MTSTMAAASSGDNGPSDPKHRVGWKQVFASALAVLALSSVSATAATPTQAERRTAFKTYAAKVRPIVNDALLAQTWIEGSIESGEPSWSYTPRVRAQGQILIELGAKLRRVRPPGGFGEPHASLAGGWRMEGKAAVRLASALAANANDPFSTALDEWAIDLDFAREEQAHWRQEMTAQLRRFGLAVPLWLKQVGRR